MVSSNNGRGRPRPLLQGVFRKACDYCVRSKRGCNGGTPCEQCIRREQPCTYSQRRKSGPRGRPLRQAPTASTPPAQQCTGTRTSARRAKGAAAPVHLGDGSRDGSPQPSAVSASSSPARTASVSSSSSEYSPSEESSSESDTEMVPASVGRKLEPPSLKEKEKEETEEETEEGEKEDERVHVQVSKRGKISGAREGKPAQQVPAAPALKEWLPVPPRLAQAVAAAAAAAAAAPLRSPSPPSPSPPPLLKRPRQQQPDAPRPDEATAVPTESASPTTTAAEKMSWPLQRSPSVPWIQPVPTGEWSAVLQQQHRRLSASVGEVPSTMPLPSKCSTIHQISMQPWEISREISRAVVSEMGDAGSAFAPKSSAGFTSQPLAGVSRDDAMEIAMDVGTMDATAVADHDVSAAPETCPFAGALLTNGELGLGGGDFSLELECPSWGGAPSLTREMSLVRAVDALGGEQLVQGVGFEGGLGTAW